MTWRLVRSKPMMLLGVRESYVVVGCEECRRVWCEGAAAADDDDYGNDNHDDNDNNHDDDDNHDDNDDNHDDDDNHADECCHTQTL